MFLVTADKFSQFHLLVRLEVNSGRLVQQGRTPNSQVLFVDSVVHPAGMPSTVFDDQRHPRQRHSSLSGTMVPCCTDILCHAAQQRRAAASRTQMSVAQQLFWRYGIPDLADSPTPSLRQLQESPLQWL